MSSSNSWNVEISKLAERSGNPCAIIHTWQKPPSKREINLAADAVDLKPPQEVTNSVLDTIINGKYNGYGPAIGHEDARAAISHYLSQQSVNVDPKNIILCSGCSSALDISITALADATKSENILIPKPASPIYRLLAEGLGIEVRTYNLLEDYNWKADLYNLENNIDSKTAAILISNPSHATGTILKENNLRELIEIAHRHRIPIISDESYLQLVFPEYECKSVAALSTRVPALICSGLSKGFLVPGWRIGWIAIWDPINAFEHVRKGLINLSQRIIGCNTVIQGALPSIISSTPQNFYQDFVNTLRERAKIAYKALEKVQGLKVHISHGTIYLIVNIQQFRNMQSGIQFAQLLYEEEGVLTLPGEMLEAPNFIRISLAVNNDELVEAIERIQLFCKKYLLIN